MLEWNLIGRCGLYCGACSIYRAYKDGLIYQERIAARFNCRPDQVRCDGCQVLTEDCWGNDCEIVACLRRQGYEFCYECAQFVDSSCDKYASIADAYAGRGVDVRGNLHAIQQGLGAEWLLDQERRWRCPSCQRPISVWDGICRGCGERVQRQHSESEVPGGVCSL